MADGPLVEVDDGVNSSGALLVSCFPSVGFVSSIVAHFLVEKLELELVGGVRHPNLPPVCLVQDGKPLPPLRFYAGEPICNMEKCDKVVLIASEIQIPADLNLPLSSSLIDWIVDSGVSSTIMVDSFAHGIESSHSIFDDDEGMDSMLGIGSTDSTHRLLKGNRRPSAEAGGCGRDDRCDDGGMQEEGDRCIGHSRRIRWRDWPRYHPGRSCCRQNHRVHGWPPTRGSTRPRATYGGGSEDRESD